MKVGLSLASDAGKAPVVANSCKSGEGDIIKKGTGRWDILTVERVSGCE